MEAGSHKENASKQKARSRLIGARRIRISKDITGR
jgi:hypothetical protein